jgi:hypothetical protein
MFFINVLKHFISVKKSVLKRFISFCAKTTSIPISSKYAANASGKTQHHWLTWCTNCSRWVFHLRIQQNCKWIYKLLLHKNHQRFFDDGFNLFSPGAGIDVLRSSLDSRYFLQLMTYVLNSAWKNAGSFTYSLPGIRFTSLATPSIKASTWLRISPAKV